MNTDKTIDLFTEAYHYNWDYGLGKIKKILKDKNCDYGIALAIYWAFQPDYYYKLDPSKIKGDEKKAYKYLVSLEERLVNDDFPKIIAYDPAEWTKSKELSNLLRSIPDKLQIPSEGEINYKDILEGRIVLSSWFKAAKKGNLELLQFLFKTEILDKEKSINIKDQWKLTALDHLCKTKEAKSFEDVKNCMLFILNNGGKKPKLTSVASQIYTIEKIDLFLDLGVNINSKDYGRNALHFVEDPKVAQYLIDKKIDVNAISKNGETAFHGLFKDWKNHTVGIEKVEVLPIVKIFLEAGVNLHIKDDSNQTALDMARNSIRKDIGEAVELLEKAFTK